MEKLKLFLLTIVIFLSSYSLLQAQVTEKQISSMSSQITETSLVGYRLNYLPTVDIGVDEDEVEVKVSVYNNGELLLREEGLRYNSKEFVKVEMDSEIKKMEELTAGGCDKEVEKYVMKFIILEKEKSCKR
jgi:hypothetical protein